MRIAGLLILMMSFLGCGRDWSLPEFSDTGCTTDADCLYGICSAGLCDETRCRENDDCRWGLCENNQCDYTRCLDDSDCSTGNGICIDGRCDPTACHDDSDCFYGLCANGKCDTMACHSDDDCPTDYVCAGGSPTEVGTCVFEDTQGPALIGDPHSLSMLDNLEAVVAWVAERHPDAFLIRIVGLGLKSDGTVDIMNDYSSRWDYGFQEGEGITEPATFVTVTYCLQGGPNSGLYNGNAGNISDGIEIPQATRLALKDATELVADFLQGPGCVAPAQASGDSIVYTQTETDPQFILSNWKGQYAMGNPVTGEVTAQSCE